MMCENKYFEMNNTREQISDKTTACNPGWFTYMPSIEGVQG